MYATGLVDPSVVAKPEKITVLDAVAVRRRDRPAVVIRRQYHTIDSLGDLRALVIVAAHGERPGHQDHQQGNS